MEQKSCQADDDLSELKSYMEQSRLNSHLNKQNAKIMKEKIADMQEKIEELLNRPVPESLP